LREITGAITANTATAPADCNGTIVWNSTTTNTAKTQTLPVVATAACANGASITIVDGAGDAASGGHIFVTAGAGSTLGSVAAGTNTLLIGAKNGSVKLTYDTTPATPNWVVSASNNPGSVVPFTASQSVQVGQWFSGTVFSTNTAGLTLTLPAASSLPTNGGITVQTLTPSTSLQTTGSDVILGAGYASPGSGTVNLPNYATAMITLLNSTTFAVSVAPIPLETVIWSAGMNLGACGSFPCFIPIIRVNQPRLLSGALCFVEKAAGGIATMDIVTATGTGTLGAANNPVSSAACDANNATLGVTPMSTTLSGPLAIGTTIGVRVNSWGGTSGAGMLQIALQ
jgi:hypothetical protein